EAGISDSLYSPGGQLPSTLDGKRPPPAGAPNYFVEVTDTEIADPSNPSPDHDNMRIWKFHVDWDNLANTSFGVGSSHPSPSATFSGLYTAGAGQADYLLQIPDFISSACRIEDGPNDCSPQKVVPGVPPQYLDVLGARLMFRLAYRNFGDHESLVASHTADTPPDPSTGVVRNGVRWY